MEIIAYITDSKERVLGGDPLTLHLAQGPEREEYIFMLSESLDLDVLQMPNGDQLIIRK